jgi:hypothetical protein
MGVLLRDAPRVTRHRPHAQPRADRLTCNELWPAYTRGARRPIVRLSDRSAGARACAQESKNGMASAIGGEASWDIAIRESGRRVVTVPTGRARCIAEWPRPPSRDDAFDDRLCDENTVERIAVKRRQLCSNQRLRRRSRRVLPATTAWNFSALAMIAPTLSMRRERTG